MTEIQKLLFELQDTEYKEFQSRLIPDADPDTIIGVRIPVLRQYARELAKQKETEVSGFLKILPHQYYDENNLHSFLICQMKDYDSCVRKINEFLPYVDNWATCDLMSPAILKKHLPELLDQIKQWILSEHSYTIRFGVGMLMRFYLDTEFRPEYLELVAGLHSEEYYVNMMIAWYFATALAKQYETALPYIEKHRLAPWTHNRTIQKAVESYRITAEQKRYLKTLKVKNRNS